MARRFGSPLHGNRFCGNTNTMEVHDLDNEKSQCQVDEIIAAGHARPFESLAQAHAGGHDNCAYCLGGGRR